MNAIGSGLYDLIYADPPWVYRDKAKSGGRGAESHYKCTPTDELARLDVPSKKDSVLLMWCTFPMLPEGLKLIKAWSFTYKTCAFTWIKTNRNGSIYMGMGHHTRSNAEVCLLATRGKGLKRFSASVKNTHLHQRLKHSQKPQLFRELIAELYGDNIRKIEMFARDRADGWDVWGNEV